jgi:hypothetical protein
LRKCKNTAHIIGLDGHIVKAIGLHRANDDAAKERAKQLVDGHDVELWQGDRKITAFEHKHEYGRLSWRPLSFEKAHKETAPARPWKQQCHHAITFRVVALCGASVHKRSRSASASASAFQLIPV